MSKEPWKSDLAELAKTVNQRLEDMQSQIGEISSSLPQKTTNPEGGNDKVPVLKCDKDGCRFSTDSEVAMMRHIAKEEAEATKPKPAEVPTEEPKRHKTVDDFLNCPECFPKFEEAFRKRGYMKKEEAEKKPEGEEPEGGFPL